MFIYPSVRIRRLRHIQYRYVAIHTYTHKTRTSVAGTAIFPLALRKIAWSTTTTPSPPDASLPPLPVCAGVDLYTWRERCVYIQRGKKYTDRHKHHPPLQGSLWHRARYVLPTARVSKSPLRRRALGRVLARSSTPEVSLSRRWTTAYCFIFVGWWSVWLSVYDPRTHVHKHITHTQTKPSKQP